MENMQKPHNFSAVLRSCDAVGILNAWSVTYNDQALEVRHGISKGASKWMQLKNFDTVQEAVAQAKQENKQVLAAHFSARAVDYRKVDYTQPTLLLLGQEGWGVSEVASEVADQHIIIPMMGMTASLNVSVAAALVLYEIQRQRQLAGLYEQQQLSDEAFQRHLFEMAFPKEAQLIQDLGEAYPADFEERIQFLEDVGLKDGHADGRDQLGARGRKRSQFGEFPDPIF